MAKFPETIGDRIESTDVLSVSNSGLAGKLFSYARNLREATKEKIATIWNNKRDTAKSLVSCGLLLGMGAQGLIGMTAMTSESLPFREAFVLGGTFIFPMMSLLGTDYNMRNPFGVHGDSKISHLLTFAAGATNVLAAGLMDYALLMNHDPAMFIAGANIAKGGLAVTMAQTLASRLLPMDGRQVST